MAHGSCYFLLLHNAAGEAVFTFTSDTPLREVGAWWECPEAVSLRAALAAALAASPATVLRYAVDDLLCVRPAPDLTVALRCAAASDARELTRQQWFVAELAYLHDTDAALMAHDFDVQDGDGKPPLRVALRTLLAPSVLRVKNLADGPWAAQLQRLTLSAPIALPAATKDDALASEVAINGTPLTPEDVRALPTSQRAALKACRSAQLLHAAAACIDARWLGGLRLLRGAVEPLLARGDNTSRAAVGAYAQLLSAVDAMPTRAHVGAFTPRVASAESRRPFARRRRSRRRAGTPPPRSCIATRSQRRSVSPLSPTCPCYARTTA